MRLVSIEAGERGDDELVALANLQLVEGEQLVVAVGLLGFELVEDAVGDEHRLRVVEVECSREGAFGRTDAGKDEVDLVAAIGTQQLEAGTKTVDVVDHDAVELWPKQRHHLGSDVVFVHDVAYHGGTLGVGLDIGVAVLNVIGQLGPVFLNIA